ncbi:MAG: adenosine kinase, partial [Alphaproteobacteria bacterium]|nr:adenosine kinase [Alphaproteobacteria bacterium]
AHALFQVNSFEQVVEKLKTWGGLAAVTRSEKGCVIVHGGQTHEIPAAPVARVLDTTGAGDQFAAGFLYGLTHNRSLPDCGKLGGLAAAEVISHYGARPEVSLAELAKANGLS